MEVQQKEIVLSKGSEEGISLIDIGEQLNQFRIEEVLEDLERELIGLKPVKQRVKEIASFLMVQRLREIAGVVTEPPSLHMSFTGPPGTGKTTVAMKMGKILHRLGYVRKGHLITASREDLVGQYVGHTAPKTKEVIKRAMGGVLFIDEAYSLYRPESERDYGQEAIEILLQAMENNRKDLVVIFAGYQDRMELFFQMNPGLRSRITHHIQFPSYTYEELIAIADLMLKQQMYFFDEESRKAFEEYLKLRMQQPLFANARSVRNAIDRFKLRQAARLIQQGGRMPPTELMRIDQSDIRQSRVFKEAQLKTEKEE
ncbi:CbbX protein [Candidatus Methylacidiphilum infernorum]|uniref:ATPase of the AAA+ class, RuBisCo-expression protein CbbX n=1 Tax=Methylacidiphilum infernorum (isolate V4) TaxID=481448 RepID=B3DVG3_METI4|nr:CbbX protein [Candidatus Methylacidiphilum infernorum]ACD83316.1 ATPase of the AAA+ class, RuBisCo-expression protein CbbX [Methylacidiphilum infernorum V4]